MMCAAAASPASPDSLDSASTALREAYACTLESILATPIILIAPAARNPTSHCKPALLLCRQRNSLPPRRSAPSSAAPPSRSYYFRLPPATQDGWTALLLAARWGHAECAAALIAAGADCEAMNNVRCCWFPIMLALPAGPAPR